MKKRGIIVLLLVLAFFVVDIFVLDVVLDREVDKAQLEDVIKTSINCEYMNFDISGKGLSLKNNVYGDYKMVVLTNCDTEDLDKTIGKLHEELQVSVDNFCKLDLLQLTFKNNSGELTIVEIRDCELTITHK